MQYKVSPIDTFWSTKDGPLGIVHKWVDQFATKPKSLFIQNNGQNLEITISLH
jgi:hypothetical protein